MNQVKAGASVRVRQLCAPPDVNQRLREIGFAEQQQVRLVSTQQSVICMVCNARLAISQQLAETIMVEPLETGLPHKR
ncbi:MAG: ferrous iron transport protein A [Verrucomicrobiales bacterium]|nr:ferrous iron transport protein A [Verrucomicrobiales bacterium]